MLQLLLTFLYSMFIQVTSLPFQMLSTHLMAVRILLSIAACAVLAIGISFTVNSGFAVLPMEGFVASLAEKEGKSFGTVRVRIEMLITVISAVISILFLGNISAVGIGTVIAAVCTGNITKLVYSSLRTAAAVLLRQAAAPLPFPSDLAAVSFFLFSDLAAASFFFHH